MKNEIIKRLTKGFATGVGIVIGLGTATLVAVTVSGTIKSWSAGEKLTAADLNTTISSLKSAIEGIGNCPADMADVGSFCIDRYEAAVYTDAAGSGTLLGSATAGTDNYGTVSCNDTGAGCNNKVFALSKSGVEPSSYITWFQAAESCRNVGKRLPTNAEWQIASLGTPDPHTTDPADDSESCNIWASSLPSSSTGTNGTADKIQTGSATACVSQHGVYDMIGNIWEWTSDWVVGGQHYSGAATAWTDNNASRLWPNGFGSTGCTQGGGNCDVTHNVAGRAYDGASFQTGLPGAPLRGGGYNTGSDAGVFAYHVGNSPASSDISIGFRCAKDK